jgi:fermentation-respiration switch protein FrsA (DUF1100 family)
MFLKIVVPLTILYLLLAGYALLVSDSMIFVPRYAPEPEPAGVFRIRAADGVQLSAIYLRNDSARYTVLYSYGNAGSLGNSYRYLEWLRSQGFSVFGYDYHGYGRSGGKPSEPAVYMDIRAAYACLVDSLKIPPDRIIAFGQSLGGAVAIDLASKRPVAGLIVESSFVTAFRVMTRIPLLPFDKFNSIRKIGRASCPVLVIHGDSDTTIPLWHGRALFRAAPEPKRLVVIPGGGHNDIPPEETEQYRRALVEFARTLLVSK